MAKKSKQSQNRSININVKKGSTTGIIILFAALVILGANWFLNQRGQALPDEVTGAAETVVEDSLGDLSLELEPAAQPKSIELMADEEDSTSVESEQTVTTTGTDMPWVGADGDFDYYVLALSWQPAFCETRSQKPECRSQDNGRFDATNFVLHGLWPNQKNDPSHSFAYCEQSSAIINTDKDGDWCDLPNLPLSATVENDLKIYMPGAESCLDHHEWYKHGTCAGMSADAYFALSNGLVASFAQTDFNQYVASQIGSEVSRSDLLNRFEDEFGSGHDDYLSLRCNEVDGISMLSEIRLALNKDLAELDDFSTLFPSERVPAQGSCPKLFVIDPVG